jgi:hypothetical protein
MIEPGIPMMSSLVSMSGIASLDLLTQLGFKPFDKQRSQVQLLMTPMTLRRRRRKQVARPNQNPLIVPELHVIPFARIQ